MQSMYGSSPGFRRLRWHHSIIRIIFLSRIFSKTISGCEICVMWISIERIINEKAYYVRLWFCRILIKGDKYILGNGESIFSSDVIASYRSYRILNWFVLFFITSISIRTIPSDTKFHIHVVTIWLLFDPIVSQTKSWPLI